MDHDGRNTSDCRGGGLGDRTYIRVPDEEAMADFVEKDGRQAVISDKEFMGLVIGGVGGLAAHPETDLPMGVDGANAFCWSVKGKPEINSIASYLVHCLPGV